MGKRVCKDHQACHPSLRSGSLSMRPEILSAAKDDITLPILIVKTHNRAATTSIAFTTNIKIGCESVTSTRSKNPANESTDEPQQGADAQEDDHHQHISYDQGSQDSITRNSDGCSSLRHLILYLFDSGVEVRTWLGDCEVVDNHNIGSDPKTYKEAIPEAGQRSRADATRSEHANEAGQQGRGKECKDPGPSPERVRSSTGAKTGQYAKAKNDNGSNQSKNEAGAERNASAPVWLHSGLHRFLL